MTSEMKIVVSIAIRPTLVKKVDKLASNLGKSRSELISRIVGSVIDDLSRNDLSWVKISKRNFIDLLSV
jgi:metal-responsive CopG/Arc/MetJ family transcriptional regulator